MSEVLRGADSDEAGAFDEKWYVEQYPDVSLLGMNALDHFMWIGKRLGRAPNGAQVSPPLIQPPAAVNAAPSDHPAAPDLAAYFRQAVIASPDGYVVTNFMQHVWRTRLDLQQSYALDDPRSRAEFCKWFLMHAPEEYGFGADAMPESLLRTLAGCGGEIGARAHEFLAQTAVAPAPEPTPQLKKRGANLIGYARGEFGMGEHVRMVAASLDTTAFPFGIVNVREGGVHGEGDGSAEAWISARQDYATNVFHINADVLPCMFFRFRKQFFKGRHNIGYWAWELPHCPPEFDLAFGMMDEVWGISEFVTRAFRERSPVPVVNMPLAVSLPPLERDYTKQEFGFSQDEFVFLFTFDSASYLERKNPLAIIRAFKLAFPKRSEKVRLVLKTMNSSGEHPIWRAMLAEAAEDGRIAILTTRLKRADLLGLYSICDAFVSLHRSEGFGRCIAEAMLLGKPVISTNYSGSREFAREGTACVVDYKLTAVPAGAYPFWQNQEWADPDVEHAASHMRRLFSDHAFYRAVARAGQLYVKANFSEAVVGARYEARLEKIARGGMAMLSRRDRNSDADELLGCLDHPTDHVELDASNAAMAIDGWATSREGIDSVEIHCDGHYIGNAHHGLLRGDIATLHPEFADAGRSGFCFFLRVADMNPGRHELLVTCRSKSGVEKQWKVGFTVTGARSGYADWLKRNEGVLEDGGARRCAPMTDKADALVSIVVSALGNVDDEQLERTVSSLLQQRDKNFEVVIATDAANCIAVIDRFTTKDVPVAFASDWTRAIEVCRGEFVSLIECGDVLGDCATRAVAENVSADATIDFLYADEDQLDVGARQNPKFKPAWSPLYFESSNYVGRPWFVRRSLLTGALNGIEPAEPDAEHRMLRIAARSSRSVCHIPLVLASIPRRQAGKTAIAPVNRARSIQPQTPLVSAIIPTRLGDPQIAARCVRGLLHHTAYPNLEIILVPNNLADAHFARQWFEQFPQIRTLPWQGAYNWSAINNFAARAAKGDYLLFLNDDVEPLADTWLCSMMEVARHEFIGAAGAMLHYPNGTIQHAGVYTVGYGGGARHQFRFLNGDEGIVSWLSGFNREQSAVTGACLLSRRECFEAVGGFDEALPLVCNDVDYCLRLRDKARYSAVAAEARLIHHEGISRAGAEESTDVRSFWARWGEMLKVCDPFSNPNLDPMRDDWSVNPNAKASLEGRVSRNPWRSRLSA